MMGGLGHSIGLLRALFIFICVLAFSGCASSLPEKPTSCIPHFDDKEGWRGGDAAYSISLPGGKPNQRRTLWLFGDSFIQRSNDQGRLDRRNSAFIHNSIGLSQCTGSHFVIHYHWKQSEDGEPRAFFMSPHPNEFWWPLDGFIYAGRLFIGLLRVAPARPNGPLHLPFRLLGTSLIEVDNPADPPDQWNGRMRELSRTGAAIPGTSMLLSEQHVLLFSYQNDPAGEQSRFLARLPVSALQRQNEDLVSALQTLNAEGRWENGFWPGRARTLMPDRATEMSVHFHPKLAPAHQWIAVYGAPIQVDNDGGGQPKPSGTIYLRSAAQPEGPWSPRVSLQQIPEVEPPSDPDLACYAAKAHPAFGTRNSLVITYVCNLFAVSEGDQLAVLQKLQKDMSLYRPRVLELPIPAELLSPKVRTGATGPAGD